MVDSGCQGFNAPSRNMRLELVFVNENGEWTIPAKFAKKCIHQVFTLYRP